jgi:hypothetical protein
MRLAASAALLTAAFALACDDPVNANCTDILVMPVHVAVRGSTARRCDAPGYAPWDTAGVRVTADQCHEHPKALTARLQPLP